jgi:predicted Rossmann fold nucleotide-binding protein DprA/Smf involved in DNA uptake
MTPHDFLTEDGMAILLLCSSLGLEQKSAPGFCPPLTLSEWNKLATRISSSPLKSASGLLGHSVAELGGTLEIPPDEAERLAQLLERGSRLTLELESLFSRGIWAITRADPTYPARLRDSLKHHAPTVLFGAGEIQLFRRAGLAVIGSRNIDATGTAFAKETGRKSAAAGTPVVSGGAKGTDRLAMEGALEAGGNALGVVADSLDRTIRQPDVREFLLDGRLLLLTPYAPTAGFSIGAAMGRNKVIYGLADFAVVVSSDFQSGGTWAGAVEALKAGWCPVFVRDGAEVPKGNKELIRLGAVPLPESEFAAMADLPQQLRELVPGKAVEQDLFGSVP